MGINNNIVRDSKTQSQSQQFNELDDNKIVYIVDIGNPDKLMIFDTLIDAQDHSDKVEQLLGVEAKIIKKYNIEIINNFSRII